MTKSMEEIIGQAVGHASMCWKDVDKAGVFDTAEAQKVVDETIKALKAEGYVKRLSVEEIRRILPSQTITPLDMDAYAQAIYNANLWEG